MRLLTRLFMVLAFSVAVIGAAMAQDRPVVVELYTSQGCSSCPPADKLLGELSAARDDVIALALHVDYWDYIGWKDEFASPSNTERQRGYARAAGGSTVYTPQMIVGGLDHVIGFKPMDLMKAIDKHSRAPQPANVSLTRNGDRVTVRVVSNGGSLGSALVQLATYTPKASVDIRRGENAGRTLTYHNIVRDLDEIGTWNGQGTFEKTVRVNGSVPVVALVQRPSGPILGAARLR